MFLFVFLKKLFYDILAKPGTKRISLSRTLFIIAFGLCIWTTITHLKFLREWQIIMIALLPYLYFDSVRKDDKD